MPDKAKPTVRQRRIARTLRAWRTERGQTMDQVGKQLRWSESKVSRIERAEVNVGPAEIIAVATILGVGDEERDRLVEAARSGVRGHELWDPYGPESLRGYFKDFVEDEAEAVELRTVETILVTGLLQTAGYAEALLRGGAPEVSDEVLAERQRLRRQRQQRLDSEDNPLRLHTILYEPALTIPIGGQAVMRDQLDHLIERANTPTITVQLLPASIGAFPGMGTSFHLIHFAEGTAAAAYVEALQDGTYIEAESELISYTRTFERLSGLALDPAESSRRIKEINETWA